MKNIDLIGSFLVDGPRRVRDLCVEWRQEKGILKMAQKKSAYYSCGGHFLTSGPSNWLSFIWHIASPLILGGFWRRFLPLDCTSNWGSLFEHQIFVSNDVCSLRCSSCGREGMRFFCKARRYCECSNTWNSIMAYYCAFDSFSRGLDCWPFFIFSWACLWTLFGLDVFCINGNHWISTFRISAVYSRCVWILSWNVNCISA